MTATPAGAIVPARVINQINFGTTLAHSGALPLGAYRYKFKVHVITL